MNIFHVLSGRLRERRESAGLTQEEAAEAVGVKQTYISNLENGHNQPGALSLIANLAERYETSVDYLFGRSNDPAAPNDTRRISSAEKRVRALLPALPDHRLGDLATIAESLRMEECRKYAFWQVAICHKCKAPLVGGVSQDGKRFYWHESEECGRETVAESVLVESILQTAQLSEEISEAGLVEKYEGLIDSLQSLGQRLGLIKRQTERKRVNIVSIAEDILRREDRSIAQAWMHRHFRIYVEDGQPVEIEIL